MQRPLEKRNPGGRSGAAEVNQKNSYCHNSPNLPEYQLNSEQIPPEFKARPQWVVWRQEERDGKPTKIPYRPQNPIKRADTMKPDTWGAFKPALLVSKATKPNSFHGIGFVFSPNDDYTGVDLDHCREPKTGEIEPWGQDIIKRLNSYTEQSPSGTGVHILIKAKVPAGGNRKGKIEMYDTARYFTMTGLHLEGTPTTIESRQTELEDLHKEVFGKFSDGSNQAPFKSPGQDLELSDFALFDKAKLAKNGHKFEKLWDGDTSDYNSPSEATAALLRHLAYWTGKDADRMGRLFRQSGLMREKWDRPQSGSTWGALEIQKAISQTHEVYTPGRSVATGGARPDKESEITAWPTLAPEALYGLAGEFVRLVEPHTEADPAALLLQYLTGFGNLIGKGAYAVVEADIHYCNLFGVAVGNTAKGRKGTSWGQVKAPLTTIDPDWKNRIKSGLSSGEGLIFQVRDPIMKREAHKKQGQTVYEDVLADPGEEDKRLLVVESEFANVLRQIERQGNVLSSVARDAWDTGDLGTRTKNSPTKATGAHVSIIGHITKDELKRYLTRTEAGNGFGNRILWLCVRRSKILPEGGRISEVDFGPFLARLKDATLFAQCAGEVTRDPETRSLWAKVYPDLSDGRPGLVGALTSRAEAQVLRLSMIYALLDGEKFVRVPHLLSALAVWDYCESSVKYIFGDSLGDPVADTILAAVKTAPDGLTRTEVSNLMGRHEKSENIQQAIGELLRQGIVGIEIIETNGRPIEKLRYSRAN